jgi:hypothetical protein
LGYFVMRNFQIKNLLIVVLSLSLSGRLASASPQVSENKGIADWLFFLNPAKTTFQTQKKISDLAEVVSFYKDAALAGELLELGINTGFIEVDVRNDRATVILFRNSQGSLSEAFKLKIRPQGEEGFLEVKARAVYSHLVELFEGDEEDLSRFEFSRKIEDLASELLCTVEVMP